jgi:hypothetical protein
VKKHFSLLLVISLAVVGCNGGESGPCPDEGDELETAMLFIEHNAADQDTGVHGNFGGEAWSRLCIRNPQGDVIIDVRPEGTLAQLGVADLFFESREPPNDVYSIAELKQDFPEGEYLVGVVGHDGINRVATATFSHAIPAPPNITGPILADTEERVSDSIVDPSDLVVSWESVTETIDGGPVQITAYQVIITKVDHDDPHGFSRPIYDVHVGPEQSSIAVPESFFEAAAGYELEVLAIEVSGNQTIALGFFATP